MSSAIRPVFPSRDEARAPAGAAAEPSRDGAGGTLAVRANKLDLLERLADDLAHEIKNPLHSMVINLEVLKRRAARAGSGEDVMRYVGVLAGELERVTQRVDLLLRLSRPGRGSEATTLNELAEELLELLRLEARQHGTTLEYDPGEHIARVRVPREPARQVILNLVLAVLDHAGAGAALRLGISQRDGNARLAVLREQGPFPAEGLEDRLAVARTLADAMGGRVDPVPASGGNPPGADGVELVLPAARG